MNIPPWPVFDADEIDAAVRVLRSGKVNYWTGEEGRLFEREFAEYVGTSHAIALSNGTVALELALKAIGVGPGDEVIVPSRTFVATAFAVMTNGATPVFADVDILSGNVTADTIAPAIGPRAKAIIPVHVAGLPCDMDGIMELAQRHGLRVIEDCAQAHGAKYKGRNVGSIGHIGAFSFCQDKIMTTGGEGGMITTNDKTLAVAIWSMKDHGRDYNTTYDKLHKPSTYEHLRAGTNARMTEMQAAIGRIALRKLDGRVELRRRNAAIYDGFLKDIKCINIAMPSEAFHNSCYRYYFSVDTRKMLPGWSRDRLQEAVLGKEVPCHYGTCCEIYREKAFTSAGLGPGERLPNARFLTENALMLPTYPTIGAELARGIAEIVKEAALSCCRP